MKSQLGILFEGIATIIFKFPDGTTLRVTTTLKPDTLASYGVQDIDGIVDLDTLKVIPDSYFELEFEIYRGVVPLSSELDAKFNLGGKVSW